MKLSDFKLYNNMVDEIKNNKQAAIAGATGLIEAFNYDYAALDEDERDYVDDSLLVLLKKPEVKTIEDAEKVIDLMDDGVANPDSEAITKYYKLLEDLKDIERDLNKVIKIVDELAEYGFKPKSISTSRLSISTYLTFDIADYDRLKEEYDGAIDFYDIDETAHDFSEFEVRISDHEVGGYFNEAIDDEVHYNSNNAKIDVNNF
ncbi:hypothetical protein [Latilactobacillus fragifolii]|uniref:hypothetical protein n=1 Tax=Latilactobacillus fragifolii TaxID=2814244 RepID=UPI001ABBCC61|nr:hypothetical protein [Latilactobacillus fragifolii]